MPPLLTANCIVSASMSGFLLALEQQIFSSSSPSRLTIALRHLLAAFVCFHFAESAAAIVETKCAKKEMKRSLSIIVPQSTNFVLGEGIESRNDDSSEYQHFL